jgi:hypothetical protein
MSKFGIGNHRGFQITFENGWKISVMFGGDEHYADGKVRTDEFSYANSAEVAVFNPNGLFYPLTDSDDVIGHQTADEVAALIAWTQSQPKAAMQSVKSASAFDDFIIGPQCDEQSPPDEL